MNLEEKDRILLLSADKLAQDVDALAVISFLPADNSLELKSPVINILEVHPELKRHDSMLSLLEYCSNHVIDAVIQYRIMTQTDSGKIVAVFPYALLVYDIDTTKDEFSAESFANLAEPEVIYSVLSLAFEIAREGREGRSVGTAFIVGDINELKRWSHQGVLNPYEGHPEEVRDVLKRENWESVKEFAQLDGVFLIGKTGIIEAAGRYLDADGRDVNLQSGLGGRHLAAAAITKVAPAVGVVVSESGGTIRVFVGGEPVAHLRSDIRLVM